jgi:acetyl esterase/lipase
MRRSTLLSWIGGMAVLLLAVLAAAWHLAKPVTPDAFYATPAAMPAPGTLLRHEPWRLGIPADAVAWRILYATTRGDGSPAAASALVLAPRTAATTPRPIIAWTHGTTGILPGCAPPLLEAPFDNVPAVRELLDAGWLYVATDYVGQGTAGPHPYLIGEGQARSALDSIRAVRQLAAANAGEQVVVWGHSQGGNAALWTGILAPRYAPELEIAGVAALAPATDLPGLVNAIHREPIGRILSSFLLRAYADEYSDVRFEDYSNGVRGMLASRRPPAFSSGRL